jgi:NAD(P)-dependent dehydrogenase (short-subunit alcohol dehydrogenase family)
MANKVVLVAGGSRGIGRATCLAAAGAGADVALLYRSRATEAASAVAAIRDLGRRAVAIQADVTDPAAIAAAFEQVNTEFGRIDTVVHSAGAMVAWLPVRDHDPRAWAEYITNDLVGAFNVIQAAVCTLRSSGGGAIIVISSIAAQMCQPRNSQGAAAKAGIEALVRVVAKEEGRSGIRINAVSVGLTDTDMGQDAFRLWGKEFVDKLVAGFPVPRIGRPEEIAQVVLFLAGDGGAYITGKVLQVDGGQFIAG